MKAYQNQFLHGWTGSPGLCGEGSQERYATPDRRRLHEVIGEWRSIHDGLEPRVIEVGCGDLLWHGGCLPPLYVGVDLHARPSWAAAEDLGARFIEGDAATRTLPRSDIAVARQIFIHLSNRAILAILDRLREARVEWLLASTVPVGANSDRLLPGEDYSLDGYPVDLAAEPFRLPYALPMHRGGAMRVFGVAPNDSSTPCRAASEVWSVDQDRAEREWSRIHGRPR